jgi:hypothetical protein
LLVCTLPPREPAGSFKHARAEGVAPQRHPQIGRDQQGTPRLDIRRDAK